MLAYFFIGARVLGWLSITELPAWLVQLESSKVYGVVAYLGLSMLSSNLSTTGAFEVYLGPRLLYSAIANQGQVPAPDYIVHLLEEAGMVPGVGR